MKRLNGAFFFCIPFVLTFLACSTSTRKPAAESKPIVFSNDLIEAVGNAEAAIGLPGDANSKFNADTCESLLSDAYQGLYQLEADHFFPKEPEKVAALSARSLEIMNRVFQLRLRLSEHLNQMLSQKSSEDLRGCVNAIRNAIRVARTAEDFIGEWHLWQDNHMVPEPDPKKRAKQRQNAQTQFKSAVLTTSQPHLLLNPRFAEFTLKSGDVLLSRGNAFSSAMIARIGDEDSQFSHIAVLHIDANGTKTVIEAHPDLGVVAAPWEKYIGDGKVRAVVFRQPDEKLAQLAGEMALGIVTERKKSHPRQTVPYDFAMDLSNPDKQFCSEVVYIAYREAAEKLGMGSFAVPRFMTSFKRIHEASRGQGQRAILTAMKMTAEETFAPADIEVDPRFELVAEWRDFSQIESARLMDAIMTMAFKWMVNDGYEIVTSKRNVYDRLTNVVFWLKDSTFLERYYLERIPRDMNDQFVKLSAIMFGVARQLGAMLEQRDTEFRTSYGVPMSFKNMLNYLESLRLEDAQKFNEYVADRRRSWLLGKWTRQKLIFHHLLAPPVQWDDQL